MTTTSPKVSVVCAWYNRADYIHDTIDSLLAQDYPNFDITVVNDGSPDPRVREILDSYDDPRLRVIHQENTGFTRAIRRAIDESDGEYIAIQGAGDVSLPGRLSAQVEAFKQEQELSIVGTQFLKYDLETGKAELYKPSNLKSGIVSLFGFSHGELMYRRDIYTDVGGYDVEFYYGQGARLWSAMLEHHRYHCIQSAYYLQYIFDDGVSKNPTAIKTRRKNDKFRQITDMQNRILARSEFKKTIKSLFLIDFMLLYLFTNVFYFWFFGWTRLPVSRRIWLRLFYRKPIDATPLMGQHKLMESNA